MAATLLPEVDTASDWCLRCGPGMRHSWVHLRDGGFDKSRYVVEPLDHKHAKVFVETYHYSGEFPADVHRYGMFDLREPGEGGRPRLVGAMILSNAQNVLVHTNAFPELEPYTESLELGRFVLLDGVPSNAETYFLGEGFRLARDAGVKGVVSFADPMPRATADGRVVMPGHIGAIYQSKAMEYAGRSTPGYTMLMPDGRSLCPRSQQKIRGREQGHNGVARRLVNDYGATPPQLGEDGGEWLKREMKRLGVRTFRHRGKHRYLARLGTKLQRKFIVIGDKMPRGLPRPTKPDKSPLPGVELALAARGQEDLFNLAG